MEAEELGINPKAWAGAMQRAAREPGAPSFALKGPVSLQVRKRRPGPVATMTVTHPFMGGEKFRVAGMTCEAVMVQDAVQINVQLQPATTDLAGEISGMTLPLAECIEWLEGFEAFAQSHEKAVAASVGKPAPKSRAERTVAQREENPLFGAW